MDKKFRLDHSVNAEYQVQIMSIILEGLSKNAIAKKKPVSKHFVLKWTKEHLKNHDFASDNRGRPIGKLGKWSKDNLNRIKKLHTKLKEEPRLFY